MTTIEIPAPTPVPVHETDPDQDCYCRECDNYRLAVEASSWSWK